MVWDISFGDWARPRKLCTAMTARYATWGLCEEDFEGISLQEFETAESRIPLLSEYKQGITLNPPFDFHHQYHQCCNDVTLIYSMPIKFSHSTCNLSSNFNSTPVPKLPQWPSG